ncbi:FUSC family protein [Nocardioides mangrovicus]|uniref:FUSC family protein n=1 Tax=Nocardioides mangrovicus TaxID=2478913 RepID=A0A3L8NXL3_9ACTN|nr:FUSC family protein [Nocardioides mangrovicus]RLV47890.1 FUSC family protein [Nocardioides mangrovicus]
MPAAHLAARVSARHAAERPHERVEQALLELRDRMRVSDPGLLRLRSALSAAVSVGTALPVQVAIGRVLGYPGQAGFAATLFGAVVAMLGANALAGSDRRTKLRTAAFFPVAVAAGLLTATATSGLRLAQVVGFAVVLFLAVWVRRFGTAWFFYGFMGWMGFFFATFLHATLSLVPELLVASVASTAWVTLLSTTVFHIGAGRALHATLAAFFAAGRSVAREGADLLAVSSAGPARRRRALRALAARQAALADASLLAEAWSSERRATPPGWSPSALRRRLIESQQAVDRIAGASVALAHDGHPDLVVASQRVLDHLARRRDRAAAWAATRLERLSERAKEQDLEGWAPARQLAFGVREFLRFDAAADDPPEVDPGEADFEAATGLVFGGLAGSPAVARDVAARGSRWNPVARLSMTSRQAVQVALAGVLALLAGAVLSPTRYYWAVITVFITFTGTGTRSETWVKGVGRTVGTLLGIVVAILLAHVTAGHSAVVLAIILVSIFLAFYFQKVSATAMGFFITLVLGELYTVLGTFTDSLLALRLGETAVGAGIGIVVALLFAPLSTRDTVRAARGQVYVAMRDLLLGASTCAEGRRVDLDAATRVLDDRARRMALVARPMVRPFGVGAGANRRMRRRMELIVVAVSQCRALTVAMNRDGVHDVASVAAACRSLAEAMDVLSAVALGSGAPEAGIPLLEGDRALFAVGGSSEEAVVRHLHHLSATLFQLAESDPLLAAVRMRELAA